ncbi:MAG TPA: hypothetical protein VFL93_14085, partial [Longimicrobiaceae bacterium]|nr:hypothetical protein [Longimicrobiaceae bacterium]
MAPEPETALPSAARELARRHAEAWAARAVRGLSRGAEPGSPPEIVVLDAFAGRDHPLPAGVFPCAASIVARLAAGARRARAGAVRVVLREEDPVKVEWLAAALDGGVAGPAGIDLREGLRAADDEAEWLGSARE